MSNQVRFVEVAITKNLGRGGMVILKDTCWEQIQMKTKTKMGWVDHVVGEIPRDDCFSRLDNWRKLLKASTENKRRVRFMVLDDLIIRADVYVTENDAQDWDSHPFVWSGEGWVPFYFAFRPGEATEEAQRQAKFFPFVPTESWVPSEPEDAPSPQISVTIQLSMEMADDSAA